MPYGKEQECRQVTDMAIVEKFETLVDVLEYPQVRLDIERGHVITKAVGIFKYTQFDIGTASPVFFTRFLIF
jgi:hypothetical protein